MQGCDKRKHRTMCAVFSAASLHAHIVSPLNWPHLFLCSLLQMYLMQILFRHRYVSQGVSYPLAGTSLKTTMPKCDFISISTFGGK